MRKFFGRAGAAILAASLAAVTFTGCGSSSSSSAATTAAATAQTEAAAAESATASAAGTETTAEEGAAPAETGGKTKSVTVASTSGWETFNPILVTSLYVDFIADQVFDRLVFGEADGSVSPCLAESWEFDEGDGGITWHLNEKAVFSDGVPVTADDIVFTAQLYSRPGITNTRRSIVANLAGTDDKGVELSEKSVEAEAIDEHTVHFTFKQPMAESFALSTFSKWFWIYPKHVYEDISDEDFNNASNWTSPVGSGAFRIVNYVDNAEVDLEANKDYFLGAPDFDYLYVKVSETANLIAGLETGELDWTQSLPITDVAAAEADPALAVSSVPSTSMESIIFNNSDEVLSSKELRQAINLAIDRQGIINVVLSGQGKAIYVPFTEGTYWYNENLELPVYNPDKAREILDSIGWDGSKKLKLQVSAGGSSPKIAVLVQQNLAAVGIDVEIDTQEFTSVIANIRETGDYQFALMGGICALANPDDAAAWLTTNRSYNFTWSSPDTPFDALFDKGKGLLKDEERKAVYDEIQEQIVDITPIAYLYTENQIVGYNNRISNQTPEIYANRNWKIHEWKVAD